jgi:hypothetical protein
MVSVPHKDGCDTKKCDCIYDLTKGYYKWAEINDKCIHAIVIDSKKNNENNFRYEDNNKSRNIYFRHSGFIDGEHHHEVNVNDIMNKPVTMHYSLIKMHSILLSKIVAQQFYNVDRCVYLMLDDYTSRI